MSLSKKSKKRIGEIFQAADLGDPRRVRRATSLATSLAADPQRSLPDAWSTEAELEAGYRFLRSAQSDFASLMGGVQEHTLAQALDVGSVLVLHDTTDVSCPSAEPEEVGFLNTGKPGFYVHHALVVGQANHLPLGVAWSQLWGRAQRSRGHDRNRSGGELAKEKHRESDRWLEGITESQSWLEGCEEVIHVADREADSFRVFALARQLEANFVIRLRHNRRTQLGSLDEALDRETIKLRRLVQLGRRRGKSMPRYTYKGRAARQATLDVTAATVTLQPPNYAEAAPVTLNVVRVQETSPPKGAQPIEWLLSTSLPIRTKKQIERVIDIYRVRWIVEEFHKALKTGCMLEKRHLESFESITSLLALSYPIACELLRVRTRARDGGGSTADVLRPGLAECLHAYPHPKAQALPDNPTPQQVLFAIAGFGGHSKHNGPPGWQTLAKGYAKLVAFEAGWLAARAQNL